MRKTTTAATVTVAGLLLISGCASSPKKAKAIVQPAISGPGFMLAAGTHDVVLDASGSGKADIAYASGANQAQDTGTDLPWQKTMKFDTTAGGLSMMVVIPQAGDAGCKITVDGKVLSEAKTDPGNNSVSCKVA